MKPFRALLFLFLLSGCQEIEKTPKPDDLIPREKMVDVLTEISLLHGARTYNKNLFEEKGIDPNKYIYEKYEIDSLQLVKSNDYYAENYNTYQDIYNEVKARLEALRVEYDTLREREERRKDSLMELERDTLLQDSIRKTREDSLLLRGRKAINNQLPVSISRVDSIG